MEKQLAMEKCLKNFYSRTRISYSFIDKRYRTPGLIRKIMDSFEEKRELELWTPLLQTFHIYEDLIKDFDAPVPKPKNTGIDNKTGKSELLDDGVSLAFTKDSWDRMILQIELKEMKEALGQYPYLAEYLAHSS